MAAIPAVVREYMRKGDISSSRQPRVRDWFRPGLGWTHAPVNWQLSENHLRGLKADGVTRVSLSFHEHSPDSDWSVDELLRSYAQGRRTGRSRTRQFSVAELNHASQLAYEQYSAMMNRRGGPSAADRQRLHRLQQRRDAISRALARQRVGGTYGTFRRRSSLLGRTGSRTARRRGLR